jgi:hypothetical protein
MKNKFLKTSLLISSLFVFMHSCNQSEESTTNSTNKEINENNFKLNKLEDTNKFETIYNDGRISAVRNSKYYNLLVKSGIPLTNAIAGLTTVIAEWNKYDANVATPEASFIQIPLLLGSPQKKEMEEAGVEANSTMVGGDVETNQRIKEPSKRYWAVASKLFAQQFNTLTKTKGISNRDTNYVTFDFITTNGFYTVQEEKSKLESNQSVWSSLFTETKFLNLEMARVQTESQQDAKKRYETSQLKKNKKSINKQF